MSGRVRISKFAISLSVVFTSFILAQIFLFPVINSDDDFNIMYMLSGGFGLPPSNLLHYNHIWHPGISWIVKTLFEYYPLINWYTVVLIFFQAFGFAIILYVMLEKFRWQIAIALYGILFLFIELRNLLSINLTASAWVLATSGMLLLLHELSGKSSQFKRIIYACLIIILASLIRMHVIFIVALLFSPLFLIYALQKIRTAIFVMLIISILVFALNLIHVEYYKRNIPSWSHQEQIRQSLFYRYNRPAEKNIIGRHLFRDSLEMAYYNSHFYYDKSVFSPERLRQIEKAHVRVRNFDRAEDFMVFYWLFVALRVYILLLGLCFCFLWIVGIFKRAFNLFLMPAFSVIAVMIGLIIYAKITAAIFLGLLLVLLIGVIYSISPGEHQRFEISWKKKSFLILLFLPIVWMGIRISKDNSVNRLNYLKCKCYINELAKNRDRFFINLDGNLPFNYFYVWNAPIKNRITNLYSTGRTPNINTLYFSPPNNVGDELLHFLIKPNTYLLGDFSPGLILLLKHKLNRSVLITRPSNKYKCLDVKKVN